MTFALINPSDAASGRIGTLLSQAEERLVQVIVADDDATQCRFAAAVVRGMRYDPIKVADGDATLNAVVKTQARILICDIAMPGPDGLALTLTRQIRMTGLRNYIHIMMVTGRDETDDRRLAL